MNLLGREHRVSFVLSSHARFLSGAHEGQWRHRYIYCQNDPVSLIDPTGYSPENTGTPARFTPKNYSNIQSSEGGMNSCYMEDYTLVVAAVQNPDGSNISMAEAGRQALQREAALSEYDRMKNPRYTPEGMFDSNDGCSEYYTYVNVGGELVKVRYDKDGNILGIEYNGENGEIVATAIHMAFQRIRNEGGITTAAELRSLLESINAFADNFSMFSEILNSNVADALFQFTYHAMIGGYVATQMQKYDNPIYNQYDMEIGFWTSFWSMRSGINMGILPTSEDVPSEKSESSLVDLANIIKAVALQESHIGTNDSTNKPNKHGYVGIMQVNRNKNAWGFNTSHWDFGKGLNFMDYDTYGSEANKPFNNIGIGVGHLFDKLIRYEKTYKYSKGQRNAPTIGQWLDATGHYHGSGTTGFYRRNIKSIFLLGIDERENCANPMNSSYIEIYFKFRQKRERR